MNENEMHTTVIWTLPITVIRAHHKQKYLRHNKDTLHDIFIQSMLYGFCVAICKYAFRIFSTCFKLAHLDDDSHITIFS